MNLSWSKPDLEYNACHEAGHAVGRTVNGDEILYVDACAGVTRFKGRPWTCCVCGGHFNPEDDHFNCNFNPECQVCTAFVTSQVCACYAGRAATAEVMPDTPDTDAAEYRDNLAAEEFAKPYSQCPERWQQIRLQARSLAKRLAAQERRAVLEVRDAVVRAGGRLDGPAVRRIINKNLTKPSVD